MRINYINLLLYFLLGCLAASWSLVWWQIAIMIIIVIFIEKNAEEGK